MHIAQISKADAFGGGASRVAEELSQILQKDGYVSHHWSSWAGKEYNQKTRFPLYGKYSREIRLAHTIVKKAGFPELLPFELAVLLKNKIIEKYDIFHFHDLSSAISPYTLSWIARKKPVIWTIHDCSPFTGGCLYPMGCEKFKTGCGDCPQIGQWPIDSYFDFTKLTHRIKRNLHRLEDIITVTPSKWMSEMAYSSGLFKNPPAVIPNGVDTETFKPTDKIKARIDIGLPIDRKIVLISAGNILDERKGTRYALEALSEINEINPFLLVVGSIDENAKILLEKFDYYSTGYISDSNHLALVYSAADLFLFCSLADNQPLVILETMAAGTPLVGFATGGIPEVVEQDQSGYLVKQRDVSSLIKAIRYAFEGNRLKEWSIRSRELATSLYSFDQLSKNHVNLYEKNTHIRALSKI
jgi:glycosyltransferase involved in cell wall biosynthesis